MNTIKVSDKYQMVIPRSLREKLGIKKGQKLNAYLLGESLVLTPRPKSYAEKMLGLGQEIWHGVDPLKYIRKERASWNR